MRFDKDSAPDEIWYDGVKYHRMGGKRKYYLSTSTTNAGRKSPKGLHVAIWENKSGKKVPADFEVHHRNGDTFDFSADNLECLPKNIHRRLPKRIDVNALREHLSTVRHLASAWHKSDEGREWHRKVTAKSLDAARAAKPSGDDRKLRPAVPCKWCGELFERRNIRRLFCSREHRTYASATDTRGRKNPHPYYAAGLQHDS